MGSLEMTFAHPPNLGIGPPNARSDLETNHYEHDIVTYCKNLSTLLSDISEQVSAALLAVAAQSLH